jgi:hypothetical protein
MIRNVTVLIVVAILAVVAMVVGAKRDTVTKNASVAVVTPESKIPHLGNVEVLNGSGTPGVANKIADCLRTKGFDVKNIGNAPTWNYPVTIVVARTADLASAQQIGAALKTDKVIMMRDTLSIYDVDVFVGADYAERIK